jgi:Holliday junction resolvasome RuvABC endonuclease subunit
VRVLGVDPSSSVTGLCIVRDAKYESSFLWPTPQKDTKDDDQLAHALLMFEVFLAGFCADKVDRVVIERVSVSWNVNTIRRIAYFESAALRYAARINAKVTLIQATSARRVVLGKGTLSKEACGDLVRQALKKPKLSLDECDAYVLAMHPFK